MEEASISSSPSSRRRWPKRPRAPPWIVSSKSRRNRLSSPKSVSYTHLAIVNISSSRDRMSQPQTESYTAAKGGISALTHALAVSLAGRVRVNSISPGWIDTDYTVYEGPDACQQPAGRVGNPMDIANMVLYLCSDKAGFITGENICIDGGMTRQMSVSYTHLYIIGRSIAMQVFTEKRGFSERDALSTLEAVDVSTGCLLYTSRCV